MGRTRGRGAIESVAQWIVTRRRGGQRGAENGKPLRACGGESHPPLGHSQGLCIAGVAGYRKGRQYQREIEELDALRR